MPTADINLHGQRGRYVYDEHVRCMRNRLKLHKVPDPQRRGHFSFSFAATQDLIPVARSTMQEENLS